MQIDLVDLQAEMVERQLMYSFLARFFHREVDSAWLNELRNMDFSGDWGSPEVNDAILMLDWFLQASDETILTPLATEYARIFLGAGSQLTGSAFPYESVFTNPRGLLMQEAREQVASLYRSEGVQLADDVHLAEDHIALELEFMSYLCEKTVNTIDQQNEKEGFRLLIKQKEFFNLHLFQWSHRWCSNVEEIASLDFYKSAARMLAGYLVVDQRQINALIANLEAITK